ncbi:30S ribosomal protein S2 [Ichthyobacterium seriolicida]|uniref:Small ribosomal subunit protein uS2 n=2 Tax=Ichthyobacterium seriolicida TaxID=242600 RepID=A0A1J1ECZ0_9FLAO|nr:30S ribosomal protein S2 [Ichthyobacterium seriolicida]
MEKDDIHIINLRKTAAKLEEAREALKKIVSNGRKVLFVSTKIQAKNILKESIKDIDMPFISERWPGGLLTNFSTIRKTVKKMQLIDKMKNDGTFGTFSKREKLQIDRKREKLDKIFGSISDMMRLPGALFVIDVKKEHIAVKEARKLGIPVFGMVDTNSNPINIDFPIPSNDDSSTSIKKILEYVVSSIEEGIKQRVSDKEKEGLPKKDTAAEDAKLTKKARITKKADNKQEELSKKIEKSDDDTKNDSVEQEVNK